MQAPPELPNAKPPLGRAFFITLLAPVASMGIAALASLGGKGMEGFSFGVSILTLPVMLVCSILCAVWVGKRSGGGMGFLAFLGIQVFYIAVACGGCIAVMANSNMNFH